VTAARAQAWWAGRNGLSLLARVTPQSSRDDVEGVTESAEGPALKVRVRAVADKGEANRAVETAVAEWLGLAKGRVSVTSGSKSRIKTLDIAGEPAALETLIRGRLESLR
jgi:uncharacterized protein YggU (UPF0235/DUF167 family)